MHKVYLIAGMHRSGSSLVANIVSHCGVYMGNNLMPPDRANPDGFFEDLEFVRLNGKILLLSRGEWNKEPKRDVCKCGIDDELNDYIDGNKKDIWALKDNRLAFTFKAWEPYFENIHWIIVNRNKDSVVNSLFRTHKDLFPEELRNKEYFEKLYDMHYNNLKEFSKNYPTLNVCYENMFSNPKKEISKIGKFLDIEIFITELVRRVNKKSKHF